MSKDSSEHLILCSVLAEMTERNKIERAKLAEMRAARMMNALSIALGRGEILTPRELAAFEYWQDAADKLTAEVLGEEVKS